MEAATVCRGLKPWEWIHDGDIFGVKDAESGEISYCRVMGNGFYGISQGIFVILRADVIR